MSFAGSSEVSIGVIKRNHWKTLGDGSTNRSLDDGSELPGLESKKAETAHLGVFPHGFEAPKGHIGPIIGPSGDVSHATLPGCMARKAHLRSRKYDLARDLWVNPRSNLRGPDGNRAWDNQGNISPDSGSRFLELADIALGLKKPSARKKKVVPAGAHHRAEKTGTQGR